MPGGVQRYPLLNAFQSFIDSPDPVYGTGLDGNITLDGSSTVTLGDSTTWAITSSNLYTATRDYYFNNLTINANVRLDPNGYRIFVKNLLTLNNGSIIGFNGGFSGTGSIFGGGAAITGVSCSLGGNGSSSPAGTTYTAVAPTAAQGGTNYFRVPRQAIQGYSLTAAGGTNWLRGGAGGTSQSGGGIIILAARYIAGPVSGTATLRASATAPAGGGVILIVSSAASLPATVATDVTGQNPGTVNYMQLV